MRIIGGKTITDLPQAGQTHFMGLVITIIPGGWCCGCSHGGWNCLSSFGFSGTNGMSITPSKGIYILSTKTTLPIIPIFTSCCLQGGSEYLSGLLILSESYLFGHKGFWQ